MDFLLLVDVNEWMSYECSDEGTYTQNIHNPSTLSHVSEDENRLGNHSKYCRCKWAFTAARTCNRGHNIVVVSACARHRFCIVKKCEKIFKLTFILY